MYQDKHILKKSFITVSGRPDLTTALIYNLMQASQLLFSPILLQKPYKHCFSNASVDLHGDEKLLFLHA